MVRKLFACCIALGLMAGTVLAEEIKAVFVKYAEGKLTVKVEDKEKTFEVPSDAKYVKGLTKLKEGAKVSLKVEGDKLLGVKGEGKKKEGDKKPEAKKPEGDKKPEEKKPEEKK